MKCDCCNKVIQGPGALVQKDCHFYEDGRYCKICAEGLRLKHGIHKHDFEVMTEVNDNYPHESFRIKKCMICGDSRVVVK